MRDNDLYQKIRGELQVQLGRYGYNWQIKQSFQPSNQSDTEEQGEIAPCVYFYALPDNRYGWPQRKDEWSADNLQMSHVESQQMEKTLQFSGVMQDTPDNESGLLVADMLKITAQALQSDNVLTALRSQGIGVLRITQIRNTPIVDEKGEYAMNPSFDVTFTHRDTFNEVIGSVTAQEIRTQPI